LKGSRTYRFITIGLTFFLSLLTVNNFSSYSSSGEIDKAKKSIIESLEVEKDKNESDELFGKVIDSYIEDINVSLTEIRFRQHSLFRIIGCLVALIGVVLLRLRKTLGLHFFVAGMIFCLFTGFFTLGIGIIGWLLNALYFIILLAFGLYFFFKRTQLA
jgi:hypothetical protein